MTKTQNYPWQELKDKKTGNNWYSKRNLHKKPNKHKNLINVEQTKSVLLICSLKLLAN